MGRSLVAKIGGIGFKINRSSPHGLTLLVLPVVALVIKSHRHLNRQGSTDFLIYHSGTNQAHVAQARCGARGGPGLRAARDPLCRYSAMVRFFVISRLTGSTLLPSSGR